MDQEEKRALELAIAADRKPRHTGAGRTIVPLGQGRKYLVLANGKKLTRAGQYWYAQTGEAKPAAHYDANQQPIRKGDGDYIRTRQGLQRVRQLEPSGAMKLTALGRKFYKDRHTEYIVEVPVIIQVTDKNGNQRTRTNEHLPVNMLGLGQILVSQALSDAEKEARIKSTVLKHLGGTRAGTLMEVSGQRFIYDRNGKWLISAMGTTVDAQGRPQTQAALHEDLCCGEPL